MDSRFAAVFAIFFQLNFVRRILNVLTRNIVESVALTAFEPYLWSIAFFCHFSLSLGFLNFQPQLTLEPSTGFEPVTSSLPWMRSTN